jgi:elongation factor P--(R)-beta-lysine ligase
MINSQVIKDRAKITGLIRGFFTQQDFLEVETPLLVKHPGTEPYLEVFETELKTDRGQTARAFLSTSPELSMKKLLGEGLGNMFQICKSFRNGEGIGDWHNHEFTILEWYRVDADYTQIMQDFEQMMVYVLEGLGRDMVIEYQGNKYDLSSPWERVSVVEAFEKYANVLEKDFFSADALNKHCLNEGYSGQKLNYDDAFYWIMQNKVEPYLGRSKPTIIYDYPVSQAALSKRKKTDPRLAERFEVYLAGLELGNAFSELIDPVEQKSRMVAELEMRKALGKVEYELDTDFISALEKGLPETGGIAVGVDRLVMLLLDKPSIQDVIIFPVNQIFKKELNK